MLTNEEMVIRELRQTDEDTTRDSIDEQFILDMIDEVCLDLQYDNNISHSFSPWYGTRYWDLSVLSNGGWTFGNYLQLNNDLLALTSITQNGVTIATTDVLLLPRGDYPARYIKLINDEEWDLSVDEPDGAIAITGEWGYHHTPSQRWKASGSTLQADIDASEPTLQVNNTDGLGIWGNAPRFSPGQLIAIGDEWMSVRTVPGATSITVLRGMQGTTAVAHLATASVSIWNPIQEAMRYATRAVTLAYKRRGELSVVRVEGVTEVVYPTPQTMPEYKRLRQIIPDFMRPV
ncbi:MAG: hypothetical protein GTO60_16715 [Gammaproteobacteria bacterium]|nr:hypothetical protein [Gammaproteobacteria bacterium]